MHGILFSPPFSLSLGLPLFLWDADHCLTRSERRRGVAWDPTAWGPGGRSPIWSVVPLVFRLGRVLGEEDSEGQSERFASKDSDPW